MDAFGEEGSSQNQGLVIGVTSWVLGVCCFTILMARISSRIVSLKHATESDEVAEQIAGFVQSDNRGDELFVISRQIQSNLEASQLRLNKAQAETSELRASMAQTSAMLQSMVEGVIAVDADERILFANNVATSMLDISADRVTGRPLFEIVRNPHVQEVIREAVQNQKPSDLEFRTARNDIQLSLTACPIASGGAVLVLHDITEMRRLESMRRDFVSGVSHELKTPLTVIQACTETLLDGATGDPEAAERFLQQILEQSERLSKLIVRMLHLARVESGELTINSEPVDLAAVSHQIVSDLQTVAGSAGLKLTISGEKELYVLADDQAVRTVLGNLVDNAIKYTMDGGSVEVKVAVDGDAAVVQVIDTGIGISAADQKRVFERFFRVERDRNREKGGTGLGLAIVKHLCQAMDADLALESTAGAGCTISVSFPFQK